MKATLKEKLKAESVRLAKQAEERGNFTKIDWFKPVTGKNMIRVLPIKGLDEPFKAIRQHLISIRKKDGSMAHNVPVRCGRDLKKTRDAKSGDCLLCDGWEKLLKVDKDKAKALRPVEKFIYLVFDYEKKTVLPYAAPSTVHQGIIECAVDFSDEDQDVFSLKDGRNWSITKKVDPSKPKQFGTSYSVRPGPNPSEFPAKMMPLVEAAVDVNTVFEDYDVEKIKTFLSSLRLDTAGDDDDVDVPDDDEDELEDLKKSKEKAKAAASKAKAKVEDEDEDEVKDEFEDEEEVEEKPKRKKKSDDDEFDFEKELEEAGL